MKAQTPPRAWAWAMMWLTSVVLPEDSGPKISTIRPRGTPPMPSARSSARDPVGIASTLTVPLSPRRISEPSPNSFLMPLTALSSAASLAFASLAETSFKLVLLSAISDHLTAARSGQLDLGQGDVSRTRRLEFRTVERRPGCHRRAPRAPTAAAPEGSPLPSAAAIRAPRRAPWRPSHAARTAASPARRAARRSRSRLSSLLHLLGSRRERRQGEEAGRPRGGRATGPAARSAAPERRLCSIAAATRPASSVRPVAEEGQGDVEVLGGNRPQGRVAKRLLAPGTDPLADRVRQVEGDEHADGLAVGGWLAHPVHATASGRTR